MKDMQTFVTVNKRSDSLATVSWMVVPNQHNWACDASQQATQESQDLLASDAVSVATRLQSQPSAFGRNQNGSNDVDSLMMRQCGLDNRCLPTSCPRTFECTNQTEATFIFKNQSCTQVTPLFLYAAKSFASMPQSQLHHAGQPDVAVFDNSNPDDSSRATSRSGHIEPQTIATLTDKYDPVSMNDRHTRAYMRPDQVPSATASVAFLTTSVGDLDAPGGSCSDGVLGIPKAERFALSHLLHWLPVFASFPSPVISIPVVGDVLPVYLSLPFAYHYSGSGYSFFKSQ
jgi:hypothetical protein